MQDGPRILVAAALGKIIEPILRQSLTDAKVRIAEDKDAVLRAIGDRLRFDVAVTDLTWMDYTVEYSFDGLDVLDALRPRGQANAGNLRRARPWARARSPGRGGRAARGGGHLPEGDGPGAAYRGH